MSKVRVGINGFGRIGRQMFHILHKNFQDQVEVVAINDLCDAHTCFHLLEYDSVYGRGNFNAEVTENGAKVGAWNVHCSKERDPKNIPWGEHGVDIVVESSGVFRDAEQAKVHLQSGPKKVIFSSPSKNEDLTLVMGVNHKDYDPAKHHMISNASCTTNCLAPVVKVLHDAFGISQGTMCTVHSYTNDQRILDMPHSDLRRARAGALNIIPTSTGAASAVAKVIPAMKGKFSGYSLRVPTPTVSAVDFTALFDKPTDTEAMRAVLKKAAEGELKGILEYSELPLVSLDFKGNPHSSIVEAEYCTVQNGNFAKIVLWYDNEWGYSNRLCDLIVYMKEQGL